MRKTMSEEQRNKISESLKKYYAINRHPRKGTKMPEELKKKITEGLKKRWQNPEYRERRKSCRGWKIENTFKMSAAQRKRLENPAWREDLVKTAAKARKVFQERGHTDETKKRISEISKAHWADPEYREKVIQSQLGPQTKHREGGKAVIKALRTKGFRCVSLIEQPIPDAIAIKDGMVFAVEYETGLKVADFDKYMGEHDYDDVIWIIGVDQLERLEKEGVPG